MWHLWNIICGVPSKISVMPEAIEALKDNIHKTIGAIQLHTIDNVLKNISSATSSQQISGKTLRVNTLAMKKFHNNL